jgi:hypothetical protein
MKELESWIERGQNVPFLREKRPRKKCTPNIGANIGAITGILLSRKEEHALLLSIESIFGRIGWYFGQKLPFHCIGAR